MKYKISKIIILMIFIAFFLTGLGKICFAQQRLNINYPTIQGITITGNTGIPQLIRYIYLFSLGIVGFVALLSMLIGAIKYIFSAGNPSKASDAKDQIFSAVLGILILLASVLILRTINPDLVNIGIRLPAITPVQQQQPPGQAYPYQQCVISRNPMCNSGQNTYRACVQSYTADPVATETHCEDDCRQQGIEGSVHCNVFPSQSQCHAVGNCL